MQHLKTINENTTVYARPDGWHFHLDRNCPMLIDNDFEKMGYIGIKASEIKERRLSPCECCYEERK